MDNILFLAHTEADGTLNKTALETLSSAIELKQSLNGVLEVALYGVRFSLRPIRLPPVARPAFLRSAERPLPMPALPPMPRRAKRWSGRQVRPS